MHGIRYQRSNHFYLSVIAAIFVGCGDEPPTAQNAEQSSFVLDGRTLQPVTEEQAIKFAEEWTTFANSGKPTSITQLFDETAFAMWCAEAKTFPPQTADHVRRKAIEKIREEDGPLKRIAAAMTDGGSYRYVRNREVDGERRVLFRLVDKMTNAVRFHELALRTDAIGPVKAYDIYETEKGQSFSESVRKVYFATAITEDPSMRSRLTESDNAYATSLESIVQLKERLQLRDYNGAMEIYRKLPTEVQTTKELMLLRLFAMRPQADSEPYDLAIKEYRSRFPDDPAADLQAMDVYGEVMRYRESVGAVDHVIKIIGNDPFLQSIKAITHVQLGDYQTARDLCQEAITAEPDLMPPYLGLVMVSIREEKFDETLVTLKDLDQRFEMDWGGIARNPQYAKFRESRQYQEWLSYLKLKDDQSN